MKYSSRFALAPNFRPNSRRDLEQKLKIVVKWPVAQASRMRAAGSNAPKSPPLLQRMANWANIINNRQLFRLQKTDSFS